MPPHPASAMKLPGARAELEALLGPWLPDPVDRAFVARCIADEGPLHHRVASLALLRLLGLAVAAVGDVAPTTGETLPVPLRLPPHLRRGHADEHYPLGLPITALERLAPRGSPAFERLVDGLTDGPPHPALANAAMVCLLDALLARLEGAPPR
jgi:hypothetical protein